VKEAVTSLTFTGKRWSLLDPRVEDVCLEDIAHALAHQCRFNGHVLSFYSVAEHAVHVAIEVLRRTGDPKVALRGLHHDDEEAYTGDMISPLKQVMPTFRIVAQLNQKVIMQALGLPPTEPDIVKLVDKLMLATEQRDLRAPWPEKKTKGALDHITLRTGMDPNKAKEKFLATHEYLMSLVRGDRREEE
jgi:hypothetical protein